MSIETTLARFGYLALVVGLLFEGETILVLAAFMARRGYLSLPFVILIGCAVTFASDQFFFWLGRTQGTEILERRPSWQPAVDRAKSLLDRGSGLVLFGFRFMYGLRTVLPFVFGMQKYSPRRFALLNFLGTLLWALLFAMAGYAFGRIMEEVISDIERYEMLIAFAIAGLGAVVWFLRRRADSHRGGEEGG
jgi:membrane protein DedA with SNARE-associated domain